MKTMIEKWERLPQRRRWITAVLVVLAAGAVLFAAGYVVGYALGAIV